MSDTPAMLERLAEAKIAAALAAVITDREVLAFWTAKDEGETKKLPQSYAEVRTLPRESEAWENRAVTLRSVVSIVSAFCDDARGSTLPAAYEAAMGVFGEWDTDDDALAEAMDIAGVFECDAVMFSPGGDCGWDDTLKCWYVTIMVDVKGRITAG